MKVYIAKENGKYTVYKDDKPFVIKGAAGYEHLDLLAESGGNAVRVFDTAHVDEVLLKAEKLNLAVIIGLPMPTSDAHYYYKDTLETSKQFTAFKKLVNKYKHNRNILMWCVGNELGFPFDLNHKAFYKQFNKIVKMIHEDDPHHPVTTSTDQKKVILPLKLWTDVDVVAFNLFGNINSFREDSKWILRFWNGPYFFSEWANDGPWIGTEHTAWGAYLEPSSSDKAKIYLDRHIKAMPVEDSRFLGACIFYWGNKQEITHTWFSMFGEKGEKTELVDVAKYIWTGQRPALKHPGIDRMTLNGKTGRQNVLEDPQSTVLAELKLTEPSSTITKVKWDIYAEDWHTKKTKDALKKKPVLASYISSRDSLTLSFKTPAKPGPYRLFATIYDQYGYITTSNTPFYVVSDDEKK